MNDREQWRAGRIETRAPAYGPDEWISRTDMPAVTIRPGDSPNAIARSIAHEIDRKPQDVRIKIWEL